MRIVVTSDFHGRLPGEVPPCDLLIVAGDLHAGVPLSVFGEWLRAQPADAIVGIAGNHDFDAEDDPTPFRKLPWKYLQDSQATINGVKIYGSPYANQFGRWAFMLPDGALAAKWRKIPADTQILVVHGPAYGLLDKVSSGEHVGSHTLLARVRKLRKLRLLATGHIHEAYGTTDYPIPNGDGPRWVKVVNASQGFFGTQPPIAVEVDL